MRLMAALCVVFNAILLVSSERKSKSVSALSLSLLQQSVPAEKLQCYHCHLHHHHHHHHQGCLRLYNVSQLYATYCRMDQPHCMVEREESGGQVTHFSRRCAERCVPGCQGTATSFTCISCCNTSRCNVDNVATSNGTNRLGLLAVSVSMMLLSSV